MNGYAQDERIFETWCSDVGRLTSTRGSPHHIRIFSKGFAMNLKLAAAILALGSLVPSAWAYNEYPSKPVKLVVGYAPGDTIDLLARMAAPALSEFFKRPFIVDNHPGGFGNTAAARVAKAPHDGHTLLMVGASFSSNVSIHPQLAYHPQRDFAPVARVAHVHNVLVVNSELRLASLAEFLTLVRATPGRIAIASAGTGTMSHLAAELMKVRAGWLNALHVPYRGNTPALAQLLGGHVHGMVATVQSAYPHVKSGRLTALAVASPSRIDALADVPTFGEAGFPGLEAVSWYGVVAPSGTPYDTVVRLNLAITQVVSTPVMKERFASQGAELATQTPDEFAEHLRTEIAKWSKVAKAAGVTQDTQ